MDGVMIMEYHLLYFPPNDVWSNGGWSVYKISGDKIAESTVRERVNPKGWYEGGTIVRHPWQGFLGCVATLDEVNKLISKDMDQR